jgi:nitrite reductase (NADH) large subunit
MNIVVVGHGMVGHKFLETLAELVSWRQVTVLAKSPAPLTTACTCPRFSAAKRPPTCRWWSPNFSKRTGFRCGWPRAVAAIDRRNQHRHHWQDGEVMPYDKLVLATGSYPFVP